MKRQELSRKKKDLSFDREKRIKDPAKGKRKETSKVYHDDDLDDYDLEILQLRQEDSLEDYFDDEDED
mgnify:CR=1 FL=1